MPEAMSETTQLIILAGLIIFVSGLCVVMFTEMLNYIQTRVPFVPTSNADLAFVIARSGITPDDYVYDLGSGNGRVVFAMNNLAGARAKGFQRAGWTLWYAKLKNRILQFANRYRKSLSIEHVQTQQPQIEFVTGNFFDYSWSEATVVYMYLFPLPNLAHTETWKTPTKHDMFVYVIN